MPFGTFLLIDLARFLSPASFFLVTLSNRSKNGFIILLGKSLGPCRNLSSLNLRYLLLSQGKNAVDFYRKRTALLVLMFV